MKKHLFFALVCLFGITGVQTANAESEIYAVKSGAKITLCFDDQKASHGTDVITGWNADKGSYNLSYSDFEGITSVELDETMKDAAPTSTYCWFAYMNDVEEIIHLDYLNTASVTNMNYMFYDCSSLTSLDLSGFNTANVTDMNSMFYYCSSLTSLDLSGFNTEKVTNMYCMFYYCSSLTSLDLSGFNTANVADMSYMFYYCSSLTSLDLSGFNTEKLTDMQYMFYDCHSLTSLDLSGFNTENLTNMYCMFNGCSSLTSLDLSGFNTEKVTNMYYMFYGCSSLTSLDLSGFNTKNVTNMYCMFYDCRSLTSLDLSGFMTDNVTDMQYMFYGCSSLTSLDLSGFKTDNVTDMQYMFYGCRSLTSLDLSGFNTEKVEDMSYMFYGCSSLTSIDLSKFNTDNVEYMYNMFFGCSSLTSLDLTGFNTGKVTDMGRMFAECSSLAQLDLSKFNTANVNRMSYMFYGCSSLAQLDLGKFNTANVNDVSYMFYGCSSLAQLDLSKFNTANVYNMSYMFYGCSSLAQLKLDNFDMGNVWNMKYMFYGCSALTELDLNGFNIGSSFFYAGQMFAGCSSLATIYCEKDWSNINAYFEDEDMFKDCTALVGGKGSKYDENFVGINAARPDKATKAPGYFTSRKEIYAVLSGKTMTLYYDLDKASKSGVMKWTVDEGMRNVDDTDAEKIKTVVLDESMKDAMPSSTAYWFFSIQNIGSITNLEYLNTDLVTDMSYMFANCLSLFSLDLGNFNTQNVTDMKNMFYNCAYLASLDLCNFNTEKVTDMSSMFSGCGELHYIYCNDDWSLSTALAESDNMFLNCNSLVGGKGTKWDENVVDKTYARPDNGEEGKGYFTAKEIYVVLSSDKKTMTIYYDGYKKARAGVVENWSADKGSSVSIADGVRAGITSVVIDKSMAYARPGKLRSWFYGMSSLIDLKGIEYLNTSEATDMSFLFLGCSSLTKLDLRTFNTEEVTNMSRMFQGCTSLTKLYLNSFNTANVTDMTGMFNNCTQLENLYLNVETFNTSNVTGMSYMFHNCTSLTYIIDICRNFDTGNVKNMSCMFRGCTGLNLLDLTGFNTAAVTDMSKMFEGCAVLEKLDLTGFDITALTTTEQMFAGCAALTAVYCDGDWSESTTLTASADMFKGCTSLAGGNETKFDAGTVDITYARPDGGTGDEGYFTRKQLQLYATFSGNVMTILYDDRIYFHDDVLTEWNEKDGARNVPMSKRNLIEYVEIDESVKEARPSSTKYWFYIMPKLVNIINLNYLNTAAVADMSCMFTGCASLTDIDVSRFVTDNVTNMEIMFADCSSLFSLDLTRFNIATVKSMEKMFYGCSSLKTLYCGSDWKETGTALASTADMFAGCTSLVGGNETKFDAGTVDITYARLDGGAGDEGYFSVKPKEVYAALEDGTTMVIYYDNRKNFHDASFMDIWTQNLGTSSFSYSECEVVTAAVIDESMLEAPLTSLSSWFKNMKNLVSIEGLENLNTANVTDMNYMFYSCSSLTSLNLSSFNTDNVTNMYCMFSNCSSLTTIYCKHDWSLRPTYSQDMFAGCTSLVGGNGTAYKAVYTDAAYARPDGGKDDGGYFTLPTAKGLEELYIDDNNGNAEDNSNNGNSNNSNNNANNAGEQSLKVFRNGQIFIIRSGRTYTVTGTLVN